MEIISLRGSGLVGSNSVTQIKHKELVKMVKRFTYEKFGNLIFAGRIGLIN